MLQCRDVRTREVGIQEIHHKVRPYQVTACGSTAQCCRTVAECFVLTMSMCSGGAGAEGLRGQRQLGDLPVLRGPGAGHPDRPAAPTPLLPAVFPSRAERRRVHRARAARLRQRRPRQQQRPQQVPASGAQRLHAMRRRRLLLDVGSNFSLPCTQGFGMMLMEEAERIARDEHGSGKLAVISGEHSGESFTLRHQVYLTHTVHDFNMLVLSSGSAIKKQTPRDMWESVVLRGLVYSEIDFQVLC